MPRPDSNSPQVGGHRRGASRAASLPEAAARVLALQQRAEQPLVQHPLHRLNTAVGMKRRRFQPAALGWRC